MRTRARFPALAAFAAAFLGLATSSCGTGGHVVVGEYAQLVIGPGGGHAAAGFVELDILPGAFTEDHVVGILPQADPLPIDPPAGQTIVYHGGIMCIGPLALELLVPCRLRACYDPTTIPDDLLETDLVLLEWDDADQVMRVSTTATQNLETHCFEDLVYGVLGHVAVGRPTEPLDLFAFLQSDLVPEVGPQGFFGGPSIHVMSVGGTPAALPGTQDAQSLVASDSGARILFDRFLPNESRELATVDAVGGASRTVSDSSHSLTGGDTQFGWFVGADRCFYPRFSSEVLPAGGSFSFFDVFVSAGGSGAPPAADLYDAGPDAFLNDQRLSPDGTLVLLRWTVSDGKGSFDRYDVIDAATGLPVGVDVPFGPAPSGATPRWLPDSSGLYAVSPSGADVVVAAPDGSASATLFTLAATDGFLVDFVVSPDQAALGLSDGHCAFVRETLDGQQNVVDLFGTDRLGGGERQETLLGPPLFVAELVYHPDGVTVWADLQTFFGRGSVDGVAPQGEVVTLPSSFEMTVVFDATSAAIVRTLDFSLASVDVSRVDGRTLIYVAGTSSELDLPSPGVYVADPDGTDPVLQSLASPQSPARWLRSWRRAPSFFSALVR